MEPLSLYLHIPFCDHKCSYCDFNSYAGLEGLMPAYIDALRRELRAWAAQPEVAGRPVPTVFFGGGTPSLTPLPLMAGVMETLREGFALTANAEVTLEANPGTVDEGYLRGLRDLGINRLSLGVQSLDDTELLVLDRIHDAQTAVEAYRAARAAGFDNVNLDLIFGLEGQTARRWARTLDGALRLAPEHLSLYALTVEEGTGLAARIARGVSTPPDPDAQAEMYELTQDRLAAAGYEHYEISNWARPGRECRHNLVYWHDGEWLGLGAGAHSHLSGGRFAVVRAPAAYIAKVSESPVAADAPWERMPQVGFAERPDGRTSMADAAILALRLSEGLDIEAFEARFGVTPQAAFGDALEWAAASRLVAQDEGRYRLTRAGRLLANEVFVRLLPD